jgi:peptidoglycan/xylan/chitin deacetylase (PgdA/CDA1 family)
MSPTIPVLLHHGIDASGDAFSTRPEVFERELAWLAERGYRSLSLDEFDRALAGGAASAPRRCVLLTFDDGYADLATVVAPALRRHGFTGVGFLITKLCTGSASPRAVGTGVRTHLSWTEARALAGEGTLEFQSHSHSHERWLATPGAESAVAADLGASIDLLTAELRLPRAAFRHLAWPWGRCTEAWERAAQSLGLTHQHLVQRGAVTRIGQTTRLPRLCLDGASPRAFRAWMALLTSPVGARACNRLFGTIRASRHGLGYV